MTKQDMKQARKEIIRQVMSENHTSMYHVITLVRIIELSKYNRTLNRYSKFNFLYTR